MWQVTLFLRQLRRKVSRSLRGIFFRTTVENLKLTDYSKLPSPVQWDKVCQDRQLHVEIGSGHGEVLLANDHTKSIIVGYEIKSRFFRLSQRKTRRRSDIFIYKGSGYESLFAHYKDSVIDRLFVLFPDPWHKKKHAKRRPLTAKFFSEVAQKLKNGGALLIATDWKEYAQFIAEESKKVEHLYKVAISAYDPEQYGLPITHYHQKWARKGRMFTAIELVKLG